jgi:hypothetical protein
MTLPDSVPIPADVADAFERLKVAAAELNNVSNQLGVYISTLDVALQRLNLGIATWVRVDIAEDARGNFEEHEIGYSKVASKWGVALRVSEGNYEHDPEGGVQDTWLFNDAPRVLRIAAVDHLPALLKKLIDEATATAQRIEEKIGHAQRVVAAIKDVGEIARTPQKAAIQAKLAGVPPEHEVSRADPPVTPVKGSPHPPTGRK